MGDIPSPIPRFVVRGTPTVKVPHLVCYDYQHGGVWAFVLAESSEQIANRYPELEVVDSMPPWMTPEIADRLHDTMTIDIDDQSNEFLAALVRQRGQA